MIFKCLWLSCLSETLHPGNSHTPLGNKSESSQEANTCMVLHLAQYFSCAVIASIDADVTFVCLANYHKFSMPLFHNCCSETRMKHVNIVSIGNVLGRYVCEALLGCMWECDSKQFCWETKIVCISISEEERFHSKNFLQGLASPGNSVMQPSPNCTCLLAHGMVQKVQVWCQHSLVPTVLLQTSKHWRTQASSLCWLVVTKQLFGKEHWMLGLKFKVQLENGKSRTKVMLLPFQLTGWKAYWLQM